MIINADGRDILIKSPYKGVSGDMEIIAVEGIVSIGILLGIRCSRMGDNAVGVCQITDDNRFSAVPAATG